MRKKIAKRRRRDILRQGWEITKEEWVRYDDNQKDDRFCVTVSGQGYFILGAGLDPLDAYQSVLWCIRHTVTDLPERIEE